MSRIPESDLDRIREAFPEILQRYGINPSRDFRVPWRDDSKPSGHYSKESNLVTDFGADARYNVFKFVGMVEGLTDFKSQVARAAEIIGLQVGSEDSSTPTRHRPKPARPRFETPENAGFAPIGIEVFEFMRSKLFENETALSYLLSRGFDKPKIWRNHLGWIPTRRTLLNDDGSTMFTKHEPNAPHGFIVIPFMDRDATSASYAMLRTIPGDTPPETKEIRPTGYKSPLFREWLLSANCTVLYVAEGLLDALALEMAISRPCLGLGGSSTRRIGSILYATPKALRPKKIVLALDDDAPGRKASERIADDLRELGIPHSSFDMPEGCKDPNDILIMKSQIGGEKWNSKI